MADAEGSQVNPAENGFLGRTVAVTGTLIKASGAVLASKTIRATPIDMPQQVTQDGTVYTLGSGAVETVTGASGSFSFYLIAGAQVRLTINAIGYDQIIDIPDDGTTTIDFLGLSQVE